MLIINKYNSHINDNDKSEIDYFVVGPDVEIDRASNVKIAMEMHNKFSDIFTGIGCFNGTVSSKVKDMTKPYSSMHGIYTSGTLKRELERPQEQ